MQIKLIIFRKQKRNLDGKLKSEFYGVLKSELDPVELKKAQDNGFVPIDAINFGVPPDAELWEEVEAVSHKDLSLLEEARVWDKYGRAWYVSAYQVDHLWIRDPEWDEIREEE